MSRSRLLSVFIALGLLLAACGDDDDTATATDDTTEDAAGSGTDPTEDDAAGEGDDDSAGDLSDVDFGECGFMADFALSFEGFDAEAMVGGEGATDFGAMFRPIAEGLRSVADDAPSEIRAEFQTMADTFEDAVDQLDGVVLDFSDPQNMDPEAMQALENMDAVFTEEFESASDTVDAWIQENCADLAAELDLDVPTS